jgi:hypothetical protein
MSRFLLALWTFLFFAPAFGAEAKDPPPAGENNVWHEWNTSDTVIVFVHGIFSDSRSAWLHEGSEPRYWPELIRNDPSFDQPSIFLGGFSTSALSGDYGMRQAAEELFGWLDRRVDPATGSVLEKRNIFFVVHSTGGILVRHILYHNADRFRGKKVGLALLASPSLGSKWADWVGGLSAAGRNRMAAQLRSQSEFLDELDHSFMDLVADRAMRMPGLVGREAYEHHAPVRLPGLERIVERQSAARYFGKRRQLPETNHASIVKPDSRRHPGYVFVSDLFLEFAALAAPDCPTPPGFTLRFKVVSPPDLGLRLIQELSPPQPNLSFQIERPRRYGPRNLARESPPDGHYERQIRLPCPGDRFEASFVRIVEDAERRDRVIVKPTEMCFVRSRIRPDAEEAVLACQEGDKCQPVAISPSVAEPCGRGARFPALIGRAHAAERAREAHWVAPSLDTFARMPAERRPGFAEFRITSDPLPAFKAATGMSHAIRVNGTPVLIDGWPAHAVRQPFAAGEGLDFAFALQNLDFSGADRGHETIEVELGLWNGEERLDTLRLSRRYIALRPKAPHVETLELTGGASARWSAVYRPPLREDKFEIFLASARRDRVDALLTDKKTFDEGRLRYEKEEAVAVVRPPLEPNVNYGLVLGVRHDSGQVQFTFDEAAANSLCRWLMESRQNPKLARSLPQEPYRYEMEPITGPSKIVPCPKLM